MSKKNLALGLFLAFIVCFLASCSAGLSSTPAPKPIKVGWTLWQGDYTLLVANQMGFFKKHGVEVEPVRYESTTQAIPDLAGAKLDGGLFTMNDVLLATNLADLKAVLVSDNGGQYSLVGSPDIQSVQGLRGKRIGLNLHTASEMFVSYMLESARLTSNDVVYVEMSPDQVLNAIPSQVDAGLVWEPYTSQALAQGKKIIYQSTHNSTLIPRLLVFRKALVEQQPDAIRAFILAWDEAVYYRINHPQESLAIISKATGLPSSDPILNSELTIYTVTDNTHLFAENPGTDPSSIYFIAGFNRDFLINIGYITNPPDINALLDPSYLK
jgi:NitT/TauT family transport system substrate-binding protein